MRSIIIAATATVTLFASPAFAQQPNQGAASIPDFSGAWSHPYVWGFEPPPSGPGPVVNKARVRQIFDADRHPLPPAKAPLVGDPGRLIGDYTNPILKPEAAAVVKKHGEITLAGVAYPTPANQCWPGGVPFVFWTPGMAMLQQPDKIMIFYGAPEFRQVRMNQPHPAQVTPSWYGDSVGHYEGDTLVIDTVGIKIGPFAMVDMFGTPHTAALHVVERYRPIDYEAAKEAWERNENFRISDAPEVDPAYKGKGYSSNLRSRMKAFSRCPGRRLSLIGARCLDGENLSVPKTRVDFMQEKTPRFRVRISRTSEWERTVPQGARFGMCGELFGALSERNMSHSAASFTSQKSRRNERPAISEA